MEYPELVKSQTLKWISAFFENVCDFTHGKEFVFLASQNTMAALIEGSTIHSYGDIPFYGTDGKNKNVRGEKGVKDMSHLYLRYERLRWIFIDEV